MIEFQKGNTALYLIYTSERFDSDENWASKKLNDKEIVRLRKTFYLDKSKLSADEDSIFQDEFGSESLKFIIGNRVGEYYHLDKAVLSIEFDLYIHKDVQLDTKSFIAVRDTSIFRKINRLSPKEIYIGGNAYGNLPENKFKELIKSFPNSSELDKYVSARLTTTLRDHLDLKFDGEKSYNNYMEWKVSTHRSTLPQMFNHNELEKYSILLDRLKEMLSNQDGYVEGQWQEEISQFILLLYPKYIKVFKEVPIKDTRGVKRRIDLLLLDSDGNVDIIEIKKPFDRCIVTEGLYRDNHIPLRELSGTIMQIEKYIFWLNKAGQSAEDKLNTEYKDWLPHGLKIKITNPSGMIIMGRSSKLTHEQKEDFEIIKRKYKNVVDVITYDDLLNRLEVMIEKFKTNLKTQK
ncbi:MAG: Shedu immune nuclease family protein [Pseudomonadota bacterium]